eukprot:TRINITY_DN46720_c0_g1_i1.p1 TRINITY_DN46720_c0_g1~~TRINITY_DN46720_c0_g1_i1.p1  ORF type:complete len:226 (-),score=32.86 TRINITY_DN46720_c0_g1_i1:36-683(-)
MASQGATSSKTSLERVSLLHDQINVVVLSIIFLMSMVGLILGEDSPMHVAVIAVTILYLVVDVLWVVLQPRICKTPMAIIGHHVVLLIFIMDTLEHASHRVNASRALLVEVNTVLLTLRRLLGRPAWCELGFYATWVLIRLVWFPMLGAALLASTFGLQSPLKALPPPLSAVVFEVQPPAVRSYASLAFAAVVLLQFYWTIALGKSTTRPEGKKS